MVEFRVSALEGSRQIEWIERTRCFCGSSSECLRTVAEVKAASSRPAVRVIECLRCGLAFSSPFPSERTVGLLYDQAANDTNFEAIGNTVIDRLKNLSGTRQLKQIVPAKGRAGVRRILDFGTGNGRFALLCSQLFSDAHVDAVDYEASAPAALREQKQAIRYLEIGEWCRESQSYDLILLRHVLEHNHRPTELIQSLRERLSETGRIYIEVPNLKSWYVGKLGKIINTPAVPFHIFHFSPKSLRDLIESRGLACRIGFSEMPLMATSLAMLMGRDKTLLLQLAGVVLHPLQIILSSLFGPPCVTAICRHRAR